jgi:hypothetical protein
MFSLKPPRHISTLPRAAVAVRLMAQRVYPQLRKYPCISSLTLRASNGLMHRSKLHLYSITSSANCWRFIGIAELFQFKFNELDASSAYIAHRAYCTGLLPDEITELEVHVLVGMLRLTFNNVAPV